MRRWTAVATAVVACALSASAVGQMPKDYPNHPIKVVVPSPAGGPPDQPDGGAACLLGHRPHGSRRSVPARGR